MGFKPRPSEQSAWVIPTSISHFWRLKGTIKINCRSSFTNIASSPQITNFPEIIQWKYLFSVLIHILGWGIYSDTFQSLKLDIEKVHFKLISLVQYLHTWSYYESISVSRLLFASLDIFYFQNIGNKTFEKHHTQNIMNMTFFINL